VLAELRPTARYLRHLRSFLREQPPPQELPLMLERELARREQNLLRILERGIFARPQSVYARLLRHAGVEQGDLAAMVEADGVEGALARLYREGVYVRVEEFKGERPIVRPGLEIPVEEADFDNPLLAHHYEARSAGSRSAGRRVVVDLDLLAHESAYKWIFLTNHGLTERPHAVWFPPPPGAAGLKCVLYAACLGRPAARWFTQVPPDFGTGSSKYRLFTTATVLASRLAGRPIPRPVYTPREDAGEVVAWLAAKRAEGTPAVVSTNPSVAARASAVAIESGLDISGTVFQLGGEPLTEAKAQLIAASGSDAVPVYAMAELGVIGIGCPYGRAVDDVHLFTDKVAVITAETSPHDRRIETLLLTSLLPVCPKLMLNVDTGDQGLLETRDCRCGFGAIGLTRRLSGIRSYDKLTSEGATFLSSDLLTLVEETLPARFGGGPTDYQLVENEVDGRTQVSIVVSPRVGEIDPAEVVKAVFAAFDASDRTRQMSRLWREGRTLEVVRREPHAGATGKIQALHLSR
jgi:hypothetical protein